ncbi:MAG: efflux RND transporter periplasmic adaptor subunit [Verrucomicrobiota bacterium]
MSILLKRITFWLALAGIASLALFVRANTRVLPIPEPPVAPPEKPFARGIGASGIIEAIRENTSIGVPMPALVTDVKVEVWDRVEKGDRLMILDDRELAARLVTETAELELRRAELRRAQRQYDRFVRIGKGPAVAEEEFDRREDDLLVAKAHLAKAQSSIDSTKLLLDRFIVRAPISGTILQVNIRSGEYAVPGSETPPMVIGFIDELQVRADVDEQLAARVQPGARAVAYRKGETENPIPLTFLRIEPYIIPKQSLTGSSTERVDTRVLPVLFSFQKRDDLKVYVGQQVDVFIEE